MYRVPLLRYKYRELVELADQIEPLTNELAKTQDSILIALYYTSKSLPKNRHS